MQSTPKAALWMSAWLTCMVAMAVAGRELTADLPVFVVMLLRSLFGLVLITPLVIKNRAIASPRRRLHLWRNLVHYTAQYAWFFALTLIPLAQVVSIEFTLPIWTAILATVFLGERLSNYRIAAIALGFAGVLIIVRPGVSTVELGQMAALYAAIGFALSLTMTKSLTRSDSALTIIFYMLAVQAAIGLLPALYVWTWPTADKWPWVAVVGFVGTVSHYSLARAMAHADATVVAPMDFLRVPLTALAGYLLYAEQIDLFLTIGAALILTGNMLNLKRDPAKAVRPGA